MKRKTKIINLFGGPGSGKSSTAGELFGYMKQKRLSVEYVLEIAKPYATIKDYKTLDDQIFMFGQNQHQLYTYLGEVDWIISDSPLLLSYIYIDGNMSKFSGKDSPFRKQFKKFVIETFNNFNNVNFFVDRQNREFRQEGRVHDEIQSRELDNKIKDLLDDYYYLIPLI